MPKMYKVIDPKTGGDCFGGAVPENHSTLISTYPATKEDKGYRDLNIGESALTVFQVSGRGIYEVVRVEDSEKEW